jgi:MoxR-like ATPase
MKELHEYIDKVLGLHGMQDAFKWAHVPFLTVDDTCGVVAFEGSSGTGKTTLIKRIGLLNQMHTGGRCGIYSADKVRYDDFVGIPMPNKETKSLDIFPLDTAIAQMETVLIDEVNRASYDNQEKFLSLIASRTIDGQPVNCKYLYVAMNPVMSEGHDVYEGVQPLDKAFGERVMALVSMKPFHEMKKEDQMRIMSSTFDQVKWVPSDEDVDLHVRFIQEAKKRYNEAKERYTTNVCEYIHKVQRELYDGTQGTVALEGRRVQFILVNILAIYAINSIYTTKSNIEQSALEGLQASFPHRLWEQNINPHQLKTAHDTAKQLLTYDHEKFQSSASNFDGIMRPLKEIREAIQSAKSKQDLTVEDLTKLFNQKLPAVERDSINHYCYSIAVKDGLYQAALDIKGEDNVSENSQVTIKNNEYARMCRISDTVIRSDAFNEIRDAGTHYKSSKGKSYPEGFSYPFYVGPDLDPTGVESFNETIKVEIGWYTHAIMEKCKDKVKNMHDYTDILGKLTDALVEVKDIALDYNNLPE